MLIAEVLASRSMLIAAGRLRPASASQRQLPLRRAAARVGLPSARPSLSACVLRLNATASGSLEPVQESSLPSPSGPLQPTNWAEVLSPLVQVVAVCIPITIFGLFAAYFCKSNLAAGLGAALKSADVLVTAVLAGLGWVVARFLSSVDKRFDATDKRFDATDKRFDTNDTSLREVKDALREVKSLLERLPVGR